MTGSSLTKGHDVRTFLKFLLGIPVDVIRYLAGHRVNSLPEASQGGQSIERLTVGATPNVSSFCGNVYFAGQPVREDIGRFQKLGVVTVINLCMQSEMDSLGFDEADVVTDMGMRYVHVPMSRRLPPQEPLEEVLNIMARATAGEGKLLVHCAAASRVGAVWTAFRCTLHGLLFADALAEGRRIGLQSRTLERGLKDKLRHS